MKDEIKNTKKISLNNSFEEISNGFDQIDHSILNELVNNGRVSLSDIAKKYDYGTTTVHKRLKRLIDLNIIKKFTVLLDNEKVGLDSLAYAGISCSKDQREILMDQLCGFNGVVEVHEVLEPYDILVKIRSTDLKTMKKEILDKISLLNGVDKVSTVLVIRTSKESYY